MVTHFMETLEEGTQKTLGRALCRQRHWMRWFVPPHSPQWSVVHLDVEPPSFCPPHQAAAPLAEKTPQTNQVQPHHAS